MKKKVQRKKITKQKKSLLNRGKASIYVFLIILFLTFGAYSFIGGVSTKNFLTQPGSTDPNITPTTPVAVDIVNTTDITQKENLQLKNLGFTVRPTLAVTCLETAAVDFLVDRSGSMEIDGLQLPDGTFKITAVKKALNSLLENFSDESLVGLQSFASDARIDLPIGKFGDIKGTLTARIKNLRGLGSTAMKSGMAASQIALQQGITEFPGRNFSLIMLTDGQPSSLGEDPLSPPDIAAEIKAMGVTIYTIGIMRTDDDNAQRNRLRRIASAPDKYYESQTGEDLEAIYNQIGQRLCE